MTKTPLERLLHRWFVQYNPLYLLSATLVLAGLTLLSIATPRDGSLFSYVGVGAIGEVYALALIGGAALLVRLDLPRPATMVALLAVFYQGDLSLNTETLPHMHHGELASLFWVALFAGKLGLLARALKLRLSRSALLVPTLAALGVAAVPWLVGPLGSTRLASVVGAFLFAVFASAMWTTREVAARRELDAWGLTVKRRALHATWAIFALMLLGHALVWFDLYHLDPGVLVPVTALLATYWVRTEVGLVACAAAVLAFVRVTMPEHLPAVALMCAVLFALHALRRPSERRLETFTRLSYRGVYESVGVEPPPFEPAPEPERTRELAWAGYATYFAAFAALGHHAWWLEVALAVVMLGVARHRRVKLVAAPLLIAWTHWAIVTRTLRAPQTTAQWAVSTLSLGFGLLVAGLFTSWRFSREEARAA